MSLSLYPNVSSKNLFTSSSAPSYAVPGDQWLNTNNGNFYIYVRDEKGVGYWVETGSNLSGG